MRKIKKRTDNKNFCIPKDNNSNEIIQVEEIIKNNSLNSFEKNALRTYVNSLKNKIKSRGKKNGNAGGY